MKAAIITIWRRNAKTHFDTYLGGFRVWQELTAAAQGDRCRRARSGDLPVPHKSCPVKGSVLISISSVMNGFLIGNRPKEYNFRRFQ